MKQQFNTFANIFSYRLYFNYFRFKSLNKNSIFNIPIVINNYNRLSSLLNQIEWLKARGFSNIFIIDNCSSYKPLLDYYEISDIRVFKVDNLGPYALWMLPDLWAYVRNSFYVYTDSDVVPVDACPSDFIFQLIELHYKFPYLGKVGVSLKIDDLPDHYSKKHAVLELEKNYWEHKIDANLFDAPVDTTFAVYKPFAKGGWWIKSARASPPIEFRHIPWYENDSCLSDEESYYRSSVKKGCSSWTDGHGLL